MTEQHISLSQFCELLALDESKVRFVTYGPMDSSISIFVEDDMQTSGTCPPLSDNTSRRPPKKGKKR